MPSDAQIVITPAQLPEGACYQTEQERLNAFAEALAGSLPGNYGTVNRGSDAPAANDRGNGWDRTNPDGSPDGHYEFFDGTWKRKHPIDPGVTILWPGSLAGIDTIDGGVAGAITTVSGPFWELDAAMAAKFPVGVGTFASGLAVAVGGTGGEERHTLATAELPSVLGSLVAGVEGIVAKVTTGADRSITAAAGNHKTLTLEETITGGTAATDKSHNTLPPYIGRYWIKRSARIYYSI